MDKLYFCMPTYKSFSHCRTAIESAQNGSIIPEIVIVDNSPCGEGTRVLNDLALTYANISIWPQGKNIGVSKAWNLIMRQIGHDYIIIANDDVFVHEHTIERLYITARTNPEIPIFYGSGASGNAFSLFLMHHWAFEKIGPFDEYFSPAYFEDNDWWYRCHVLAGLPYMFVDGATYNHIGSSTLQQYTPEEKVAHHNGFRRNEQYYIKKWGGAVGKERFTIEFDGILS